MNKEQSIAREVIEAHPAIKDLPDSIVDEIYAKYIAGEKIKTLIDEYSLTVSTSQFYKIFPPIYDGDSTCRHCKNRMYFFRPSKTSSNLREQRYCSCGHYEPRNGIIKTYRDQCSCSGCRTEAAVLNRAREKEKQDAIARRRVELLNAYTPRHPVSFESLSLRDVVGLMALVSCRADENLSFILPLSTNFPGNPYSPTEKYSIDLLRSLFKRGILEVDAQHSSFEAFSAEDINTFYLSSVHWKPNIFLHGENLTCSIETLWPWLLEFFSNGGWLKSWNAEIIDLWTEIGVEECVQYLHMKIQETKSLQFTAEEKTRAELRSLLQSYSVAQIYMFCYMAVKDASAFLDHVDCNGVKHASNTIPGKLKSIAAKYSTKGKEPFSYHRDTRAPRSSVSYILFNTILNLEDDAGFQLSPSIYWEQELKARYCESTEEEFGGATSGKHYLTCLDCTSPDVNLRFNEGMQILMECTDCGSRTTFAKQ